MKRKCMLLIAFCIGQVAAAQDWKWLNPCPAGYHLSSVYFTGRDTGYVVGEEGAILKTTDGCATLTSQLSGTTRFLHAVAFADAGHGCVVGNQGEFFHYFPPTFLIICIFDIDTYCLKSLIIKFLTS